MGENRFYIFVHNDLDLSALDIKFAPSPIVRPTFIQCYVPSELKVSTAFLFRENRRRGTDWIQHLMRPLRGPHNNNNISSTILL